VDETLLASADAAYEAQDWEVAASDYLAAVGDDVEGTGRALHHAGNALMRLKRLDEASAAYARALEDETYEEAASVASNLGTAEVALGRYAEAVEAFRRALEDPDYPARYKAHQGLAGALCKLGQVENAAEDYRKAALDGDNPEPGKALNNLGMCFMELDRPQDAVQAYRAAVDLDEYAGRGRAAANLGMAYAALGMHERAVAAFERARDDFGHKFSPSLEAAYRASKSAAAPVEKIEGWSTGEMPPIIDAEHPAPVSPDAADDTAFFTITEDEMREADRDARRVERQDKQEGRRKGVALIVWGAIVLVIVAGLAAMYLAGIGYPTQQMTVNGMMEAYGAGESVDSYWVAAPTTDVDRAMASLPPAWASYDVELVSRSARTALVEVTVTLEQGGVVTYEVSLAREGVGWKVNGVTNSFSSMGGGV